MGFWKTLKWNAAAISIGSVVLGVILAGWPAIAARTVCYLLAAVLLLGAFSYLLSYLSGRRQSLPSGMDLAIGLVLVLAALLVAVKSGGHRDTFFEGSSFPWDFSAGSLPLALSSC